MNTKLTNVQVTRFLHDFEEKAELILLEEAVTKKELTGIAKARGINLKGNTDLIGFKCIYAFADEANDNGAYLPEEELLKALPSMVGKPVNLGHNRSLVVGHLLDYRYKKSEKQVIAYGVFYRSNFTEEYSQAKKDFKVKKLNVSFEIWSPKDKRKARADGSEELHQMEIAGMAILFKEDIPAFEGSRVLEFSNKLQEESPELVYASKYKEDEILIATPDTLAVRPEITKIKCSNCSEEFESGLIEKIKCPKCFAILNKSGQMIFPPQIQDFRLLCPSCKINNWLILSKEEDKAKVKCMSCAKEYELTFATEKRKKISDDFEFLYTGRVPCIQCGKGNDIAGLSSIKVREITCRYCGLSFSYNITHDKYKKIINIFDMSSNTIDSKKQTSEKGGQKMDNKKKVEKEHDFLESTKKENKEEISKKLSKAKVEDTKKEKAQEAPKTEEKPKEAKTEEKVETPKKEEAKKETPKVEKKSPVVITKKDGSFFTKKELEDLAKKGEPKKADTKKEIPKVKATAKYSKTKSLRKAVKQFKELERDSKVESGKLRQVVRKAVGRILDLKKSSKKTLDTATSEKERLTAGLKKFAEQIIDLKKRVELYESSATEIVSRRNELGDCAKDMSEEDILNDDKFAKAKLEKENAILKASASSTDNELVGSKKKADDWYSKKRKAIDKKAFPKPKK